MLDALSFFGLLKPPAIMRALQAAFQSQSRHLRFWARQFFWLGFMLQRRAFRRERQPQSLA
jgi:hypothetical protein